MAETDIELARRCLAGDHSAFAGILELYQDRIYSFALRLLKNEPAAEDAAQETFVKAYRSLSSYNSAYPFSSWLFRIAHNNCMDVLRAGGKMVSIDGDDFPDLPDTSQGVADIVAASVDSARIEALLASLPPLYSEVLLLQYREDLGPAEIARVINAPEGTVKARLFRARELVKTKLAALAAADATVQGH